MLSFKNKTSFIRNERMKEWKKCQICRVCRQNARVRQSRTQRTNLHQQICCVCEMSGQPYKVQYTYIIYFYFLSFTLSLLSSLFENYFVFMFISIFSPECLHRNVQTISNCSTNVYQNLDQIYFIKSFNAFILDNNFYFLKYANELIHVETHLTSFKELTMTLHQT